MKINVVSGRGNQNLPVVVQSAQTLWRMHLKIWDMKFFTYKK